MSSARDACLFDLGHDDPKAMRRKGYLLVAIHLHSTLRRPVCLTVCLFCSKSLTTFCCSQASLLAEWDNQKVRFNAEETVAFTKDGELTYLYPGRDRIYAI